VQRAMNRTALKPFFECNHDSKKERLSVRVLRQADGFVCERELVERDGSTTLQVLPFHSVDILRYFLSRDPFYEFIRHEVGLLFRRLQEEMPDG
jgi:hypothetical protein